MANKTIEKRIAELRAKFFPDPSLVVVFDLGNGLHLGSPGGQLISEQEYKALQESSNVIHVVYVAIPDNGRNDV